MNACAREERLVLVDFSSIGCALASRFCREAKTHAFSKTHKSFGKVPRRDDLIKIINFFKLFSKSKHRKSS